MNTPAARVTRIEDRRRTPAQVSASDVLRWAGLGELADPDSDAIEFPLRRVPALATLYVEGQPLQQLYCVASGSFKSTQNDVEGYEQVLGFALHGDMLGMDALCGHRHASSAVALEDSAVVALPFAELLAASREVPALARLLLHAGGAELQRRGVFPTEYAPGTLRDRFGLARPPNRFAEQRANTRAVP